MQEVESINFGEAVTKLFKESYARRKNEVDFLCKFGSPLQKAKATLIRDIALDSSSPSKIEQKGLNFP
jgi:hypothetical protein